MPKKIYTTFRMNYGLTECHEIFAPYKAKTVCKGRTLESFYTATDLPGYCRRLLDKYGDTPETRARVFNLYFGSCANFRPAEAMRMYALANAKTVLDPCAGWGGRLFGAMAMGLNYIGYDTNIELIPAYQQLIDRYHTKGCVELKWMDSSKADFSLHTYDTVLTSPPYFNRERYEHMPIWRTKRQFKNEFLIPMVRNAFTNLQSGGNMFINVPDQYYPALVEAVGTECNSKHVYRKTKRNSTSYTEYIYQWHKV